MRIRQAYISPSVADFPFLEAMDLEPYHDIDAPAVFYGVYTSVDLMKIIYHRGFKVIRWCGQDALIYDHNGWFLDIHDTHHVTPLTNVIHFLENHGIPTRRIFPENIYGEPVPRETGPKVYAYCPASFPEYHGIDLIEKLQSEYDILIGDGLVSQRRWYDGVCEDYYLPSFVGLMLSPFAGGGQSIIDMGLRGRRCITNIVNMPNTIRWGGIDDIRRSIDAESKCIGQVNEHLAQKVYQCIDKTYDWLDIEWHK